jgi:hypothetical protein
MWFAGALAALIVAIALHGAAGRLFPGNALPRFLWIGLSLAAVLGYWLHKNYRFDIEFLSALLIYAFGCELYIFVFTFSLYSVSANLLVRLRGGPQTEQQVSELYDSTRMIERRLDRLSEKQLLLREDDRLQLTKRGSLLVSAYAVLDRIFGRAS